jgi:hypothetical protein
MAKMRIVAGVAAEEKHRLFIGRGLSMIAGQVESAG